MYGQISSNFYLITIFLTVVKKKFSTIFMTPTFYFVKLNFKVPVTRSKAPPRAAAVSLGRKFNQRSSSTMPPSRWSVRGLNRIEYFFLKIFKERMSRVSKPWMEILLKPHILLGIPTGNIVSKFNILVIPRWRDKELTLIWGYFFKKKNKNTNFSCE